MKHALKNIKLAALISLVLILPFMIMEVVNRRNFDEDFPLALFFGIWFILLAMNLILMPIVQGRWVGNPDMANPDTMQGNTLLTNPKLSTIISIGIILSLLTVSLLNSLGLISMEQRLNGTNAEKFYVFGIPVISRFIMLVLVSLPIVAGIIAGGPVARTLRAGGSLFEHPVNLIIVVLILSTFAMGLGGLIIDQWPCFVGVPNCD